MLLLLACVDPTDSAVRPDSPTPDSGEPPDSGFDTDTAIETSYTARACVTAEVPAGLPEAGVDPQHGHYYRTFTVPDDVLGTSQVLVYFPAPSTAGLWNDGAPVVVTASPPENSPEPYFKQEVGIVEVQPLYPGDGSGDVVGPGVYDGLGPNSAASVAAAIRFAGGLVSTEEGWSLGQVAERTVCNSEVFVLAVSQGGAPTLKALADNQAELGPYLGGLTTFESATLPQIMAADVGRTYADPDVLIDADGDGYPWDDTRNVDYFGCDDETCAMDYSRIAFTPDYTPADFYPPFYEVQTPGMLYLDRTGDGEVTLSWTTTDLDQDGAIGADEDFPLMGHQGAYEGDGVTRLYPTLEAIDAAIAAGALDEAAWPEALATRAQAEAYWEPRTLNRHVPDHAWFPAHARYGSVFSAIDHGVPLPDRPHVTGLHAAFAAAGWEVAYNDVMVGVECEGVGDLLGDWPGPPPPGAVLDQVGLDTYAMPEDIDAHGRAAAVLQQIADVFGPFENCPY